MQRFFLFCRTIFLIAILFFPRGAASIEGKKSLTVGVVLSLSGPAAMHGEALLKGAEFAAEDLRAEGWEIVFDVQDDQTNPAKSVSALQFLGAKGHRLFIGPTWSFLIKASRPTIERMGGLAIAPVGSSDINGGASSAVINLCKRRADQTGVVATWLRAQKIERLSILTPHGDWGESHDALFQTAAKEVGIAIVHHDYFDFGIDLSTAKAMMARAKTAGAQLLMTTGTDSDVANLVKARNELKMTLPIVTTDHMRDVLASHLLSHSEVQDVYVFGVVMPEAFGVRYQKRFGQMPLLYTDKGYDAVRVLARAAESTDGSPSSVRHFLQTIDMEGASGRIRFDPQGDIRDLDFAVQAVQEVP